MKFVIALAFLFGLGISGFAAYMAMQQFQAINSENQRLRQKASEVVETTTVLLATREMRYGMPVLEGDAKAVRFPVEAIPAGAFTTVEELLGPEDAEQRLVTRTIEPNEIIMASKVTGFGERPILSFMLEEGTRATTINVNVSTGVSGFLQPGDRVDIFWSTSLGGQSATKLLLEDIQVIAIDQTLDTDGRGPTVARTLTVAVDPLTVATLTQAQTSGTLVMSLRGVDEDQIFGQLEVTQADLIGAEEVEEAPKEEKCFRRIRRSLNNLEMVETDCDAMQ